MSKTIKISITEYGIWVVSYYHLDMQQLMGIIGKQEVALYLYQFLFYFSIFWERVELLKILASKNSFFLRRKKKNSSSTNEIDFIAWIKIITIMSHYNFIIV